jgi:hypothetical protein
MADEWATRGERIALAKRIQKVIRETGSSPTPSKLYKSRESYREKEKDIRDASFSILDSLRVKRMPERDRAFVSLAIYLFLAEGACASYMNFLCFMLVSQGHDLYNIFKKEFATSFAEIEDVNLETKERFLKEHHLGSFSKGLKRKLRNAIAHHDFKVEKNGTIRVKGQIVDINGELVQLCRFMAFLHGATKKGLIQVQEMMNHQSKTNGKERNLKSAQQQKTN